MIYRIYFCAVVISVLVCGCCGQGNRKTIVAFREAAEGFEINLKIEANLEKSRYDVFVSVVNRLNRSYSFPVPYPRSSTGTICYILFKSEGVEIEHTSLEPAVLMTFVTLKPGETLRVQGLTLGHFGYGYLMELADREPKYRDMEMEFCYDPNLSFRGVGMVKIKKPFIIKQVSSRPKIPMLYEDKVVYQVLDKSGNVTKEEVLLPGK